jgi:hypothetical protein
MNCVVPLKTWLRAESMAGLDILKTLKIGRERL